MAGEVLVDALPYIDQGYDEPGVREAALAMVEEETRRYRPTKNYLEHLPTLNTKAFETELMRTEFERLQARQQMEMLSMKRYELPQPTSGKMTDVTAWSECVDNSMAQLEHQALRINNLELMNTYGSEQWKSHIVLLVKMQSHCQHQLRSIKRQIMDVNFERKTAQLNAGEKLSTLESSWVGLVSKNYEIERACADLEKEIQQLEAEQNMPK